MLKGIDYQGIAVEMRGCSEGVYSEQLDSVVDLMQGFQFPWLIGGGWSIDLALGTVTRQHDDVDIYVFREHVQGVLNYFCDWDITVAIPGEHRLEACRTVQASLPPRFGLHLRKGKQFIEILLTDRIEDDARGCGRS